MSVDVTTRPTLSDTQAESSGSGRPQGAGRILLSVFEKFDRARISYCVLHGYDNYPDRIESDVDCVLSSDLRPRQVAALLHEAQFLLGAEIVRWQDYYIVVAGRNPDGSHTFLKLDLCVDYEIGNLHFYSGSEALEGRRKLDHFWVPAVPIEFSCYLIKKVIKGRLEDDQGRRLSALYRQDPINCGRHIARFWNEASSTLIVSAARSGNWTPVKSALERLSLELRRRARSRHPWQALKTWSLRIGRRVKQAWRPDTGLNVVLLGPDGAGKSSVVREVSRQMEDVFARTICRRFPPGVLQRLLRRPEPPPEKAPHGSPPRPFAASVVRAIFYWFAYYAIGYWVTDRVAMARSGLIMHDRHLADALVDPIRYRYGGPPWLLRLIWRLIPKPDLVILLDAPADVLQGRKQEVPYSETARQRNAYRALLSQLTNGHVVDATQPLEQVASDVTGIILHQATTRIARRLRLGESK